MHLLPMLLLLAFATPPAAEPAATPEARSSPTQPSGPGLWIGGIAFGRDDIAAVEQSFDSSTAVPDILLTFTAAGQAKFARAQQGRIEQVLEVAVDGELIMSPILVEPIAGAQLTISGTFTVEEAAALAARMSPNP
ncbi:MAG: SecDF P1 head subdomain-containing protein [Allosphingosinicella sp.]